MSEFCHLHCHTQYSLLDGAARIKNLVSRAAELEMPAIAITDHGNLYGVPEFYTKAKQASVQPIIGCEFYITPSGMGDKSDRTRYHQVLLAKNEAGYRNLIKLSSDSYTDGYYYKPRVDKETLRRHSEGLIATTCCLQGEVLQTILKKGEDEARKVFMEYLDIFGEDYYIELQDHDIADQQTCNAVLARWSEEFGVKAIVTNDVHYVNQEDSDAQDVLLCLQTGKDYDDPNRMRFENNQFYFKDQLEMRNSFSKSLGQGVYNGATIIDAALENTREVAEKCLFDLKMGDLLMPHFPIPDQFDGADAYLRHLTFERAKSRYGEITEDIRERLDLELGIISTMGYAGYFLIVQDFTTEARRLGVSVGPGRGSAAGSCVAYCLGVTNIDPLEYDLLFERFLNPERVSMPDIDIDFDDRGRSKVIDYVVEKYGRESVCQIVTFGTMGSKSVIRDVARVLNIPLAEADRIAKLIPDGVKVSLEDAKKEVPEFRKLWKSEDSQIRNLVKYATVLEGSARHTGVHAAGVIIAPGDVSKYVPVAVQKGKNGAGDTLTTQYDGKWIEEFGLLKMDFLGLKTLTVLDDAIELIKNNSGVEIDLDNIPLDDEATYKLFQRGDTIAIFQFESDGMREYLRQLKPTELNDLIAMNALYRPGPMKLIPNYIRRKHGKEEVDYPHPMLEKILETTYGIPVYQEQVMQMAQEMGGYTLGGADLLRRAMGKKKPEEMRKQRAVFQEGASKKNGVDEQTANRVFDLMEEFAGYGFNKSHSAAYSLVAYQAAYLKAHYPAEFMAAVLTNDMHDSKRLATALEATRLVGIDILPPCVNRSMAHFTVEKGKIRFGLAAIKGVGHSAINAIIEARDEAEGAFDDIFHLVRDLDLRAVGKKTLEALAMTGAMDHLEGTRAQQAEAVEIAWAYGQKYQADQAAGQNSLFGGGENNTTGFTPSLPAVDPWPKGRILRNERKLMGFYVSGHPLDDFAAEVRAFATMNLGEPENIPHESNQSACGIITEVTRRTTRAGKPMAFVTIEDTTGSAECVLFSQVIDKCGHHLEVDEAVLVRGKAETSGELKLIANDVLPMWKVRDQLVQTITLRLDADTTEPAAIDELASLCEKNKGHTKLYFDVEATGLPRPVRLHARTAVVEPTPELMKGLNRLFGREAVVLEGDG